MRPPLERQEAERLVETYSDLVLRLSYSYLNQTQDAQDICQTVFLKLLERAPDFVSSDHEKAWIIRTTANTCKDLLKSHWRRTTVAGAVWWWKRISPVSSRKGGYAARRSTALRTTGAPKILSCPFPPNASC